MKATRFNFYYLFFFLCAVPVISQEKNTPKLTNKERKSLDHVINKIFSKI